MNGSIGIVFSARIIFAVCYGLQQKCSKDSLYLEHFCCKTLQTFGEKILIVPKKQYLCFLHHFTQK